MRRHDSSRQVTTTSTGPRRFTQISSRPSPTPDVTRRRALVTLCSAIALEFVAFASFTLVAPLYGVHLGAGTEVIGGLVSLGFLLPVPLAVPIGSALRRVGVRVPLVVGPLVLAAGMAVAASRESLVILAVAEVLVGLGHLGVVLASQTAIGGLGPAAQGEANFGMYGASVAFGQMIGPIVAGTLGDAYGLRISLLVGASAAVVAALVLAVGAPRRTAPRGSPLTVDTRSLVALVRAPRLRYAVVVSASFVLALMTHSTFVPVYLDHHGFSSTDIGAVTGLLALVTVVIRPLLPVVTRLVGGRPRAIPLALTLAAIGVALIALPPRWPVLVLMSVLLGAGLGLGQPLSMVVSRDAAPPDLRGAAFGYRIMTNRLTQLIAPAALGLVAGVAGTSMAFLLAGVGIAVLLPVVFRYRHVAVLEQGDDRPPLDV